MEEIVNPHSRLNKIQEFLEKLFFVLFQILAHRQINICLRKFDIFFARELFFQHPEICTRKPNFVNE